MSIANKYYVFRLHEFLITMGLAVVACWAVYPENRLTELVLSEGNSPVSVKYLESIVRLNPNNASYRILLTDRYLGAKRYEQAMAQLLAASGTAPEVVFSRDVRLLALYKQAPRYFKTAKEHEVVLARVLAIIRLETSRQRLGAIYAETSSIGVWPAALAASEKILTFETWNRFFWLLKAAEAAQYTYDLKLSADYYIKAAAAAPDMERRRTVFRKAFTTLAAAGQQKEIKEQLYANAAGFAGDKHTAGTLLSFARQTGDAYFARDIARIILRSSQ